MKNFSARVIIAASLLGLAACGGTDNEAAPEVAGSIAEPMHEAIGKAEAVEDQVMEHKEAVDQALETAEEEASDGE